MTGLGHKYKLGNHGQIPVKVTEDMGPNETREILLQNYNGSFSTFPSVFLCNFCNIHHTTSV